MKNSICYTILVDNAPHTPLLSTEHGLSIWIDTGDTRILFDTGQSDMFLKNSQALGIDISTANHLVLSHGHYDHSGGLATLERVLPKQTPIHAHLGIFSNRYSRHADGTINNIGLPDAAQCFLQNRKANFYPALKASEIAPGIWVSGFVPRLNPFEKQSGDFWLNSACTRPDFIDDDISLWIEQPEGLWIFLGCAHAGTINTVKHIQSVSGRDDIHAIIGGMHLGHASEERLEITTRFLTELAPEILLPCHCSGKRIHTMFLDSMEQNRHGKY